MKRTEVVRFRCTPEERKVIEDHARNDALSLSEYLLKLVKEDQRRRKESVMSWDEIEQEWEISAGIYG